MKKKKITDQLVNEVDIRAAIDGYFSINPIKEGSFFYEQIQKTWNRMLDDFESEDCLHNETGYIMFMTVAREEKVELFERCNSLLQKIDFLVDKFILELERYCQKLPKNENKLLQTAIDIWKELKDDYDYAFCIEYTELVVEVSNLKETKIENPCGNVEQYIKVFIYIVEREIKDLAAFYAGFWGIDSAIECVTLHGDLYSFDQYLNCVRPKENFRLARLNHKSIRNLISAGHLIDPATKLRFLSLRKNDNKTMQEAYDIILSELQELGYTPSDYLPVEAKTLADRARRYRKKRFKELGALIEN
ncbi:hypothetical protein ACG2F4_13505 [Halalkalibaculum sp. DA3122]|uniref:hypothetical protein n=1 Tax=Halalkalibaculum sp. DA3122 TaxID=3373607 RepID=UPI0037549F73